MSLRIYDSLPSVEDLDAMLERNTSERNLILKTRALAKAAKELAEAAGSAAEGGDDGGPLMIDAPPEPEACPEPESPHRKRKE